MNRTRRALLDALREGPVAGPALADRLGVSRTAVWKQVEALRDAGFEIESRDAGYAVAATPEYGGAAVEFGLDAPFEVEYHDSVPSTNDRARELAAEGATDVAVLADEQTGGRGRLDRAWNSPAGGVWLSVVCRPSRPPAHVPALGLAAAVATARAAREAGVDARIKWPNDLLIPDASGAEAGSTPDPGADADAARGGAKLAGILTEMEGEADRVSWLVVGVGVNANVAAADLPPGATSLRAERGGDVDRRAFVQRALEEFHALRDDPEATLAAWRDLAATLGRRVRVETPDGPVVGEAVDVTFPGALVIRPDGAAETRTVHAGDCDHLRRA